MEFIDVSAKTIEDAIAKGVAELNLEGKELVETQVVSHPSGGFLGIGRKPAVVRMFYTMISTNATEAERAEFLEKSVSISEEPVITRAFIDEDIATESDVYDSAVDAIDKEETVIDTVPKIKKQSREVSKEDQSLIAEKGKQFLDDMFKKMGLTVFIEKMTSPDKITFQIHGDGLGILIGKHGQTLDAIQYLTNLVANKENPGHCHIIVDVENYRSRREDTLTSLAKRLASKVKKTRQKVSLEPMNAFERKIIHTALQNEVNIVTDSEGAEPYRYVVISYKKK